MWTLAKLVPFRDYLYAVLAIAAVTYYNVHVHNLIKADEYRQEVAIQKESAKVLANAHKVMDDLSAQHASDTKIIQERADAQHKIDADLHSADLNRLRQLAAQSNRGPALGSAAGPTPPSDTGRSSLVGLGYVSAELAGSLRDARDDLGACYAERDSLTGK